MSTLAEIEAAIETLPENELDELKAWFLQRDAARPAENDSLVARQDSIWNYIGTFNSGDPHGSSNEKIDEDLAREAGRGLRWDK